MHLQCRPASSEELDAALWAIGFPFSKQVLALYMELDVAEALVSIAALVSDWVVFAKGAIEQTRHVAKVGVPKPVWLPTAVVPITVILVVIRIAPVTFSVMAAPSPLVFPSFRPAAMPLRDTFR